jgi:hypothetical protein
MTCTIDYVCKASLEGSFAQFSNLMKNKFFHLLLPLFLFAGLNAQVEKIN